MTGRARGSKNARSHVWTAAEKAYLAEVVPGRSHAEACAMMRKRFGSDLCASQIKGAIPRYGLNTGRTGRFERGHVPANKGTHNGGWPPTQFKKGIVPANRVPLGTEKLRADGYLYVKTQDGKKNANWKQKHIVAWEAENGPVPEGHALMFRDGDRMNCTPDNLIMVSRNELVRFNNLGMKAGAEGITEAGVLVARIHNTIAAKRKERRS